MRILALDQSTTCSGWSVYDGSEYTCSGVIDLHTMDDIDKRTSMMALAIYGKIAETKPSLVVIENIQQQAGVSTLIALARLQGCVLGYCAAHHLDIKIIGPSQWRKCLGFKQGAGVKRAELKQQSVTYVKEHLGFDLKSIDEMEAICINIAAQQLFNLNPDDVWGE